jgi:tRNA pseudouridine38-40 synthase
VRYRATLAYDGAGHNGFQRLSARLTSIQGTLELALEALFGQPVLVVGAGRTDAGVHASGQVVAFDVPETWQHGPKALQSALNANLPASMAIRTIAEADPAFNPRYDALSRTYHYRVYAASQREPLLERWAWRVASQFEPSLANQAAAHLLGQHDFASFGTPPRGEKGTTVRQVLQAQWQSSPPFEGVPLYCFRIEANAFLYHMVRRIVCLLVRVGTAQPNHTPADFRAILEAKNLALAKGLAPAHGLVLTEVKFRN